MLPSSSSPKTAAALSNHDDHLLHSDDDEEDEFERDLLQMLESNSTHSTAASKTNGTKSDDDSLLPGVKAQRSFDGKSSSNSNPPPPPRSTSAVNVTKNLASDLQFSSRLSGLKSWGQQVYRTNKQKIAESMGSAPRTVDLELETRVNQVKLEQTLLYSLLTETKSLYSLVNSMVQTQKQLHKTFSTLSSNDQDLAKDYEMNATCQGVIASNGELLCGAISNFNTALNNLCTKVMEDTLATTRAYETQRLEYDALRFELQKSANLEGGHEAYICDLRQKHDESKAKFERMRDDLNVKITFLNENRVKVLRQQLTHLHNATSAFFSGNAARLRHCLENLSKPDQLKMTDDDTLTH